MLFSSSVCPWANCHLITKCPLFHECRHSLALLLLLLCSSWGSRLERAMKGMLVIAHAYSWLFTFQYPNLNEWENTLLLKVISGWTCLLLELSFLPSSYTYIYPLPPFLSLPYSPLPPLYHPWLPWIATCTCIYLTQAKAGNSFQPSNRFMSEDGLQCPLNHPTDRAKI